MRGNLIIFLKAPLAGRVKTRLGREVGAGRAAVLFRRMTEVTLKEAKKGPWRTVLAIDPSTALYGFDFLWGRRFERMEQAKGDLGERMKAAIAEMPKGPIVIIGADAPGLKSRHLKCAFTSLSRVDAVFGPAEDGGYWLIGLARRKPVPGLFKNVRWSTPFALDDTLKSLPDSYSVEWLPVLRDVDDASDLAAVGPLLMSRA